MSQHYTNPEREQDPHALPDLETFEAAVALCASCEEESPDLGITECQECSDGLLYPSPDRTIRWWYNYGSPGCLPDAGPFGPFDSEAEALVAAREEFDS